MRRMANFSTIVSLKLKLLRMFEAKKFGPNILPIV